MPEVGLLGPVEDQSAMATGDDKRAGAPAVGTPSPGAGTAASSWTGGLRTSLSTHVVDFTGISGLDWLQAVGCGSSSREL